MFMNIGMPGSGSHREYTITRFSAITPPDGGSSYADVQFTLYHHQKRGDTMGDIGELRIDRHDAEQLVRLGTAFRDLFDTLDRYKHTFGQEAPIDLLPKGEEMALVEQALRENRPIGDMEPID